MICLLESIFSEKKGEEVRVDLTLYKSLLTITNGSNLSFIHSESLSHLIRSGSGISATRSLMEYPLGFAIIK